VFREDGYFNMTKAAKAYGKQLQNFWVNQETRDYMEALRSNHWNSNEFSWTQTSMGRNGGTWGHPKLAVFFARWLDVKFAVWCDAVIDDILKGNATLTITRPEESNRENPGMLQRPNLGFGEPRNSGLHEGRRSSYPEFQGARTYPGTQYQSCEFA
jgi:hypothetical protein